MEQSGLVDLRRLVVRPIDDSERALWDHLMKEHHYLGFQHLVGESVRYVALLEEKWVATFVDHTLFSGSCYRAAGFIPRKTPGVRAQCRKILSPRQDKNPLCPAFVRGYSKAERKTSI